MDNLVAITRGAVRLISIKSLAKRIELSHHIHSAKTYSVALVITISRCCRALSSACFGSKRTQIPIRSLVVHPNSRRANAAIS